ncbi:DUF6273 domain-containing protein [Anaerotruncus rubiinfantis]|uniref:DUF6273 domain-containing protein n=1 Tax=Anaerotruncus rubiinfantis TaxID=1720200 RepID=UPI00082E6BB0|nr:DUF6273 domain-containing protein [Anaerotruncus rubiinfantis]
MIYGEELGGGGISTKTIPPQGLNLTLKGGNGKIDCTFTGIASQWLYLGQYYRLIAKPGSAPSSPMDGVQIKDVQVGAIGDAVISASIEGLTNGVQYYVRLYVRGDNGWQTSVDAVGTATPVAGIAISTLAVGSEVKLNLGGVPYNHLVVHQGNPDTVKYDASCNGSWCMIKNIYEKRAWGTLSTTSYANSTIHEYLDGTYLGLFDSGIQNAIKQVKIPYLTSLSSTSVYSGENGLSTKVFLPAASELGYVNVDSWVIASDGKKLDYFILGRDDAANKKRIAYYDGIASLWWSRSSNASNSKIFDPSASGGYGNSSRDGKLGIRPIIIFPSDLLLAPEPNPDGSYSPLAA